GRRRHERVRGDRPARDAARTMKLLRWLAPRRWLAPLLLALAPLASAQPAPAACPPAAQPPTAEQAQAGLQNARDRGFLWRLRKDGHVSYLYGTVHVARQDWMVPGPTVMAALRASDTLALELDMLDPDIQERLRVGMAA